MNDDNDEETFFNKTYSLHNDCYNYILKTEPAVIPAPAVNIPKNNEQPKPKPPRYTNGMKHRVTLSMAEFMKLSKVYVANLMGCNIEDIASVSFEDDQNEWNMESVTGAYQLHYTFSVPMTPQNVASSKQRAEEALKDRKIDLNL